MPLTHKLVTKEQLAKLASKDPRVDPKLAKDYEGYERTDTRGLSKRELANLRKEQENMYEENFKSAHTNALKNVKDIQKTLKKLSGKIPARDIDTIVKSLLGKLNHFLQEMMTIGDTKTYAKTESLLKMVSKLYDKYTAGEFDSLAQVREKFASIHQKSMKLKVDEDLTEEAHQPSVKLEDLKPVNFTLRGPALTMIAPLSLIIRTFVKGRALAALHDMHFEQVQGSFSSKKAMVLVISHKATASDKRLSYQNVATALVKKVNETSSERLAVIFDVSKQTKNYFAVWLIPEKHSSAMSDILDKLGSFEIFIKQK